MGSIKVTVGNSYLFSVVEEFICTNVDILDKEEMEYCAEECVGQYLEMHNDLINILDADWDSVVEACYYSLEEVSSYDL